MQPNQDNRSARERMVFHVPSGTFYSCTQEQWDKKRRENPDLTGEYPPLRVVEAAGLAAEEETLP